ncbi:MAG: nucleotide exchange factor GrpE [Alteromonas sp.]|nr:nucleotide exchange factor GrpE [Alteromonas sp.]MAY23710.1 nucleotide exchange factor GrpE [Flavobacteriaceae bacterium]|tara:strand:- start:8697 stop:9245 length:549 start_codon:yes stop_codon:yes gene_type:complete
MSKKNKEKVAVVEEEQDKKEISSESKNDTNEVKDPVETLKQEVETEKDRYLRLFAEFENYKKRTGRERLELFKTASQDVMVSLLPVLDDFERALKEIEKSEDENLYKGVLLINNKLKDILTNKGLEVVETKAGDTFDGEIHEAVTQIPAPSDELKGKIVDVIEKGYKLGERIIRYPKVVTGK